MHYYVEQGDMRPPRLGTIVVKERQCIYCGERRKAGSITRCAVCGTTTGRIWEVSRVRPILGMKYQDPEFGKA